MQGIGNNAESQMDEISKLAGLLAEIRATASRPPLVSRDDAVSVEAILSRLAIIAKCEASLTKTIEPEIGAITQLEDGTSKD